MQQITSNDVSNNSLVALLFHQHAQAILIYLHRYISSKEDADDILVEVFLAALENRTLLTLSDDQQRSWLKKVAHNKAIDYRRSAAFRLKAPLDKATHLLSDDERHAPEQAVLRHEDEAQLRKRLASLSELQQEVVYLRFVHDLRTKDIARHLGKSDGAIRMILSRALNLLRGIYNQQEEA